MKQAVTLQADVDLDTLFDSGLYYNGTIGNTPDNNYPIPLAGSLLVISRQPNNTTQRYSTFSPSGLASDVKVFERSNGSSGWSPWVEIYHSGNTNFNEVLGDGTTGLILWGQAYNSSEIRFFIPIFKNKVATGITVQGTFSLSYLQNFTASGLDGGDIQFLDSSRNLAILRVTGLSNLNLSRQYNVFAEQASAKITLNF